MRKHFRRRLRLKFAVAGLACGTLFQAATCTSTPAQLSEQLAISIVDQFIVTFVSDQFNVTGGFF